ncbi:MAG: L-threonylcarbamoyladenylate synthase [Myxococcota bacterium]
MLCQRLDANNPDHVRKAADLILQGELVAFPTETVYGLGALGLNEAAIQKVYDAKGRPGYNPLIQHVASADEALKLFKIPPGPPFSKGGGYWPGPLTLVGFKADHVPLLATAGLDKVAVRVPAHPVARELLRLVGAPVVAPSANASTRPSSTTADHVFLTLGDKISAVLDGGPCEFGLESTVVDFTMEPPVILRQGALILPELTFKLSSSSEGSPGRLDKHYAPIIPEIRWASAVQIASAPKDCAILSHQGHTPASYAKDLFAAFYRFEQAGYQRLWIEYLPEDRSWDGIRDRIQRALTAS